METAPTYPAQFDCLVGCAADLPSPSTSAELACNWGDAEDCRYDNTLRAEWAGLAVQAYAHRVGLFANEPIETAIGDLLSDLMHLCDVLGLEFDGMVTSARRNYEPELRGEF